MKSEKMDISIIENEIENEQLRNQAKKIGKKILDKDLRQDEIEKVPDGYLTARSLAENIGVAHATVNKKVNELHIIGTKYKDKRGIICSFLSPEQQQQIRDSLDYLISAEKVPDGYLTARSFAEKINVDKATIGKRVKELQIEGSEYKDERGIICTFLSPEQQQAVLDYLEHGKANFGEVPEGYLSADSFAQIIGVDWATVKKKMDELQIKGTEYKDKRNIVCSFLSPEQQQRIEDSLEYLILAKDVPDGYITINKMAEEIGVDKATVRKRIRESRIEMSKYKDKRGIICSFLSPEQQQQIRELFSYKTNIRFAPDGYLTADAFSKELNVSWDAINTLISKLQIERTEYKDKRGIICSFLSPEQQQQIRDSLDYLISAEKVPDGYLTTRSFAEKINVDKATIGKRVKELQIEGSEYKDERGIICTFLSPEQQSVILESLEDTWAGTSIPENTVAFYFEKAGQNFEQGSHPDWLKNPDSGRNLEIDIFVDPPGIGIEYDGKYWHQNVERDTRKDSIAQESGHRIIHIREDGCPEMPEGSVCIKRKNNNDDIDLGECVKKCFEIIGIPVPDIDVARDKKDIMAFMRQKVL
ncbi:MAG: hypothetical protein K6G49_03325, partial [Candidatus Saccharibacteria bacterium]|nr:hypothetical protein [Candidatus Saccharibacteria bacterium]